LKVGVQLKEHWQPDSSAHSHDSSTGMQTLKMRLGRAMSQLLCPALCVFPGGAAEACHAALFLA
jgi:hypothetical protein